MLIAWIEETTISDFEQDKKGKVHFLDKAWRDYDFSRSTRVILIHFVCVSFILQLTSQHAFNILPIHWPQARGMLVIS